jgi:hypothetical protein
MAHDRRYRTEPVELARRPHRAWRERQPLKKLAVDESTLLKLLHRWREEAAKAGHRIKRIAVSFEAGRDGFWLARWLSARDTEAHVIHASSVAVSPEHRSVALTSSWLGPASTYGPAGAPPSPASFISKVSYWQI